MDKTVSVITPAFQAFDTIVPTVRSVLAQTHPDWRLAIVSDDGADYCAFLAEHGIRDTRIACLDSGGLGRGASAARNVALETITTPYVAILDADDRFKPDKLAQAVLALDDFAIVSTGLDIMTDRFAHLRHVGLGQDQAMTAGTHKWTSFSMDSMLVWDRRRTDGRYDTTMSNMTDLELLLQLYRAEPQSFHLAQPLHDYVKRATSMSNGPKVAAGMIASKTTLLDRLGTGYYALPASDAAGVVEFLLISIEAERHYEEALARQPGLLFEDHLEPMLQRARISME